jgi:ornithine carbamoyltransferase
MAALRHFLDLHEMDAGVLRGILDHGKTMKAARPTGGKVRIDAGAPLGGMMLAMLFEKPSTRTRMSFNVGMRQLGGQVVILNTDDLQLGRGESIADTARVMSRYVDAIMIRANRHQNLLDLASHASVPVINGLTDDSHPCQLMADVMTFEEHRGAIGGQTIAWVGDGNNVAASWIHAASKFGFNLRLACPENLRDGLTAALAWADKEGAEVTVTANPNVAVAGADCIVTDTWISMGDADADARRDALMPYQVDERLMSQAASDAIFMHCLPAHRGEEATAGVIDSPASVVWDEAENRMHAQKAVLSWAMIGPSG